MFISRDPIGLMGGTNTFAYAPNPTGWIDPFGLAKTPGNCNDNDKKLSDNGGFPSDLAKEYDEIRLGKGLPRQNPDGSPKIFEGRKPHERQWTGATEYEVRRNGVTQGDRRILQMPDGRMGYTVNHYRKISPFPAPWYPDGGSNNPNNWRPDNC